MKAVRSFVTSVTTRVTTVERHIPEDRNPQSRGCENVKTRISAIHGLLSDVLTLADEGDCYVPDGPAQVGIEHTYVLLYISIYIKVKVTLELATNVHRGSRRIAQLFV
jgi:hypothetical protein